MKHIAFVTYNAVGNLSSGWHDRDGRRALVLQNTKGRSWAAQQGPQSPDELAAGAGTVRNEIDALWGQLQNALPNLDHIVVYVGASGSEQAIALASSLPASKVTFVGCDCSYGSKVAAIRRSGLTEARWVWCECGGHWTMGRLFESFMAGELLAA